MAEPVGPGADALDQHLRWMLRVVTHEGGVDAGLEAAAAEGLLPGGSPAGGPVVGDTRLDARDRLHIYAYAFFARIHDVMADELPATRHLLGPGRFEALLRAYLRDHPPGSFSLDRVGAALADWLDAHDEPLLAAAADIVRVERAMDRAFDAPPSERLAPEALATPDLAHRRLVLAPSLILLALRHDVIPAMDAARADREAAPPPERPTWVVVYRTGFRRRRRAVPRDAFRLLQALASGASLGEALERVGARDDVDTAALIGAVGGWFQQWTADGWIVALA